MGAFTMALRSIGANKMRSVLTMLGIIIGVMALVVLVSLVSGATSAVTDEVSSLGSSLISVTISDDKGMPITRKTLTSWMKDEPGLGLIAPYQSASAVGKHGSSYDSVTVYGTTPEYYEIQALQLSMGRWLKAADVENNGYVCVLTTDTATELIGYEDCVGQTLTLGGVEYIVVGVLSDEEESLMSMMSGSGLTAYIPITSLMRLTDSISREIDSFYVAAPDGQTIDDTEAQLERILMERFAQDEDAFTISTSSMLEDALSSITSILSLLLGGIAAISLIVGGIGIMNIMMVTVTERTREIGIRKAIGASRLNILMQFLMEAVVLCMMGCGLGIFLSWAILQVVSSVVASTGITFGLNISVVAVAVIFCFLIGVIFGLYPANKAAKMKPIDALHYGG